MDKHNAVYIASTKISLAITNYKEDCKMKSGCVPREKEKKKKVWFISRQALPQKYYMNFG